MVYCLDFGRGMAMKKAIIFLICGLVALLAIRSDLTQTPVVSEQNVPVSENKDPATNDDAALSLSHSRAVIAVDAGHGGSDAGYVSDTTIPEKDINLDLARAIGRKLSAAGYQVIYTRENDDVPAYDSEETANKERLNAMKNAGAQYLISIRLTNNADPLTKGFAVFTQPGETTTRLANEVGASIAGINLSTFAGVDSDHYANFSILTDKELPSMLLELGYITNPDDYAKITDSEYQERIGEAVASAFLNTID